MSASDLCKLSIEGMDCASCALSIEKKLKSLGLQAVSVSYAASEAVFEPNSKISDSLIRREIESLGYKVNETQPDVNNAQSKIFKSLIFCLVFTLPLWLHMFWPHSVLGNPFVQLLLATPVVILGIFIFGKSAWGSVKTLSPNMDVLILLGAITAYMYSCYALKVAQNEAHAYLFFETAASIITLVLTGNLIEKRTVTQTTSAVRDLMKLQPAMANRIGLLMGEEKTESVKVSDLKPGDPVLIRQGDTIPADSKVYWGEGMVNFSSITGESEPLLVSPGSEVPAGAIVENGLLKLQVTKAAKDSMLSEIIKLVQQAAHNKPPVQKLGDKVSAVFVPAVVCIAIITSLISFFVFNLNLTESVLRGIAVMVISCPCAMGLATPTAVMAGLGKASKNGVLIKGGAVLENMAKAQIFVFDKTGTLTNGKLNVSEFTTYNNCTAAEAAGLFFSLEQYSNHPVAQSICSFFAEADKKISFQKVTEHKGKGVEGYDDSNNLIKAGKMEFIGEVNQKLPEADIYLSKNGILLATLKLTDEWRKGAIDTIKFLQQNNYRVVLLSGDRRLKCDYIANAAGITEVYAEQSPIQKIEVLKELKKQGTVLMCGDGINDAPALSEADVSVSLKGSSSIAINAAQIVLVNNQDLTSLIKALNISKLTYLTIKQNLFWAFFYNVIAIPLAMFGWVSPVMGMIAMTMSDVMVIGNSIRLKFRKIYAD